MYRCVKCGNTDKFYASQSCRGSVDVYVDGAGHWLGNTTSHGGIDESSLNFDDPEPPHQCYDCQSETIEWVGEASCHDCGRTWAVDELVAVKNFLDRIDPEGELPNGECPDCGGLCYGKET